MDGTGSRPVGGGEQEGQGTVEAPSARARALREEIFGSALTLEEVAYILSLDRTTVARYLRDNVLGGFQIGREWLVPEEELRAYVSGLAERRRREAWQGSEAETPPVAAHQAAGERLSWDLLRMVAARKGSKGAAGLGGKHLDRFTGRARRVLELAQEEAIRLGHTFIDTEHILLGLLAEGKGVGGQMLVTSGLELTRARSAVEARFGRGGHQVAGEVGLTPRAKKMLELAVDEARRMGHHYIGTEHMVLGLARLGEGIAAEMLAGQGLTLERARAETLRVLQGHGTAAGEPAEAAPAGQMGAEGVACHHCAALNGASFRYCSNCGTPLAPADTVPGPGEA